MPYSGVPEGSETEKKIERCVKEVMAKNPTWDKSRAIATCRKSIEKKEADMSKRQESKQQMEEMRRKVNAGVPLEELYDEPIIEETKKEVTPQSLENLLEEYGEEEIDEVDEKEQTVDVQLEEKETSPPVQPEQEEVEEPEHDTKTVVMDILGEEPTEEQPEVKESFDYDLAHTELLLSMTDQSIGARLSDWFAKAKLSSSELDTYPVDDKQHVRISMARAVQMIEKGGKAAEDARKALPKIRAAAKKMGIGKPSKKNQNNIIIHKDMETGKYRFVGWVSGKWKDRDGETIADSAHREFKEFVNDNENWNVTFRSFHAPIDRTYPIDFWTYQNGFVIVSGEVTEQETVGLMKAMRKQKLGMSHGFFGVRDKNDPSVIIKYRTFEVSDLPLDTAAFAWSDLSTILEVKQSMNTKLDYLRDTLGEEKLQELVKDTQMKQAILESLGVEEKSFDAFLSGEEIDEPETETKEVEEEETSLSPEMVEVLQDALGLKGFNLAEIKETLEQAQGALALMPAMADEIVSLKQELETEQKSSVEKLSDLLTGNIAKRKKVLENRPSQSESNVADEEEEIMKSMPKHENSWLAETAGVEPVAK